MTHHTKATPRPWKVDTREFHDWGTIFGPDNRPVATTILAARYDRTDLGHPHTARGEVEANAALIVEAVNGWDELRVSAQRLSDALSACTLLAGESATMDVQQAHFHLRKALEPSR